MPSSSASPAACAPPNSPTDNRMAGQIDEFDLIARLFAPLAAGRREALGLLDDVALIDGPDATQWAVSCDTIVAGVHFLADDPPDLIARKLVRVNLSDLAGKSAVPRFALLAGCFPRDIAIGWLERFAAGLRTDCASYALALIGGDTVATPGPLTLSLTVLGELPRDAALLRSGARPGDHIWVSGTLGDAALGLLVAKGGVSTLSKAHCDALLQRYRLPQPRLALGRTLRGIAHAAMDISDGLLADLAHLCAASKLSARIDASLLPISPAATAALAAGIGDGVATLAGGGDDYELLFTAPPSADAQLAALAAQLSLQITRIGRMDPGRGVTLVDQAGAPLLIARTGYRHFDSGAA